MATVILNNIEFTIVNSGAGEYFFQSGREKLHPQTLAKAVRDSYFEDEDLGWFSSKHGNFSVKSERAEAWVKQYLADSVDEQLDLHA